MTEKGPLVGVLALQGDVRQHRRALAGCGLRSTLVRRPGELAGVDALVLPGGESTTMSRLLVAFDLMEPLRARLAEGMPTYGACAGMILLGREILDGRPDQQQLAALDVAALTDHAVRGASVEGTGLGGTPWIGLDRAG